MMIENRVKKFCTKFGIQKPVMNAPMAGVTTPAMVAAVSNAGGLGILAGDLMNATKLAQAIDEVRALTSAPFAVNLRVPAKRIDRKHETDVDQALDDLKQQLGLSLKFQPCRHPDFDSQFEVLVDKQVEIVCASFGGLREIYADKLKDLGVKTIGAATTLREAKVMRSADVDAIIVQGVEAGGPRLNFEQPDSRSLVGLLSLIGPALRATQLPIIAAGGIATGAQMAASLLAGADAVMLGTALVRTEESGAHPLHKQALSWCTDAGTILTRAINGRLTRVIPNGLVEALESSGLQYADYPSQQEIFLPILEAARRQDRDDLIELAAGQGAGLARSGSCADVLQQLCQECAQILPQLESHLIAQ